MHHRAILVGIVIILAACLVALMGTVSVQAGVTFTVDDTADALDANPGDGACATTGGTCTLRAAIMETNALTGQDTVVLPSGVYTLTIGGSGEDMATLGDLDITDDLTIAGAGAQSTIIDGNSSVVNDRVVHVIGSGVKVAITGATIQNGFSVRYSEGGGIYSEGKIALTSSAIADNVGTGIVCARTGILTVTNSTINDNTFFGIDSSCGHLTVTSSSIYNNGRNGIRNSKGEAVVAKSKIRDNKRSGIENYEGKLFLEDSTVSGNTQPWDLDKAGGITNDYGTVMVIRSSIRDNTTAISGGGVFSTWGSLTIISSTICGNMAGSCGGIEAHGDLVVAGSTVCSNTGGGICCDGHTTYLTNSTISENRSPGHGGGITFGSGSLHLNNVTVAGNTADADADGLGDGGGIYVGQGHAAYAANSIIAGNIDSSSGTKYADCSGTLLSSQGYNLVQDTSGCFIGGVTTGNLTGVDPRLDPLQDNGSATFTHALLAGSPAIDAANPAGCTDHLGNPLLTDQRGRPRVGLCDMGAYEVAPLDTSRKTASTSSALPGDPVTYTIALNNVAAVDLSEVQMTDTLPISLTCLDDSLTATAGTFGYANRVITWTGSLITVASVTITFGTTISTMVPLGTDIINSAIISGVGEIISRTATVFVGHQIYLPVVMRASN